MEEPASHPTPATDRPQPRGKDLFLDRLQKYERAPHGLKSLWETTRTEPSDSTANIFLRFGDFAGWLALILARKAAEGLDHFDGKAKYGRLISEVENENATYQELLAKEVLNSLTPDLKSKTDKTYERNIKPLEKSNSTHKPGRHSDSRKRQRVDRPPDVSAELRSPVITPSPNTDPDTADGCSLNPSSAEFLAEAEHVVVNAALRVATRLFPRDLSNAIRRNPDPRSQGHFSAAISMSFPNAPYTDKFGCQMTLYITSDKTQYLAQKLFRIRLEVQAGLRYVCFAESSAKVLPNSSLTLQGCPLEVIPEVFGDQLSQAIIAGPKYQDDSRQWRDSTDAVSMVVTHSAHEDAVIILHLGLWEGTQIKKKLYA